MTSTRPNSDSLWCRLASGEEAARRDFLADNLRLVYFVARNVSKWLSDDLEFDELVSAGTLGLVKAMENFEPSRGLAFSTFAAPRIRGAILDEVRRLDHVPRSVRRKSRSLGAAADAASRDLHQAPTDAETASRLGIDIETFWRWKSDVQCAVLVPIEPLADADESGRPGMGQYESGTPAVDDSLAHQEEVSLLRDAIARLSDRERVVLSLYYFEDLKLHEIAAVLEVTESRVSQIRTKALADLRAQLRPLREQVG